MHTLLLTAWINRIIPALGWTLIHSLWQGLLLAIVTGVVMIMTKKAPSAVRYIWVFAPFLLFLLATTVTFIYEYNHEFAATALLPLLPVSVNPESGNRLIDLFNNYFTNNAPLIVMIWFIVFTARAIRLIAAQVYTRRMRNFQVYAPAEFWQQRVNALARTLQLKRAVVLLESGYAKVPVVTGSLKPIILIPVGMLTGLPAAQVEAVLLHELAHIRRGDVVVNSLQLIAEAIFFFNPGLLWVSALIREERENCCDDVAIAQTGNKKDLVQALISFKEHALYGSAYATAFPGKKSQLLQRVMRIAGNKNKSLSITESIFFAGSILVLSAMLTTAVAQTSAPKRADTSAVGVPVQTDTVINPAKANAERAARKALIARAEQENLKQAQVVKQAAEMEQQAQSLKLQEEMMSQKAEVMKQQAEVMSQQAEAMKQKAEVMKQIQESQQEQYLKQQRIIEEERTNLDAQRKVFEEEAKKIREQQRKIEADPKKKKVVTTIYL